MSTDIAPKTTNPNSKQLQSTAANAVVNGMTTSTEVIRYLKTLPCWMGSKHETPLKKQLEQFIDTYREDIEPYPIRKAQFLLDNAEDMLRGDIAAQLEEQDLSDPRDVREIASLQSQMLTNPQRGPHDLRAALLQLGNPADLQARFDALYPAPEKDEEVKTDGAEPTATPVPAGDDAGVTASVSE